MLSCLGAMFVLRMLSGAKAKVERISVLIQRNLFQCVSRLITNNYMLLNDQSLS